ncbi:MAG: maleylpyruvate isomerase N-terminal domain-containing protein [Flavitalea sp.]
MNHRNHQQIIALHYSLENQLFTLLNSLTPAEWEAPTIAKRWKVKDIASHLLDTTLRGLSTSRDNYFGEEPKNTDDYSLLVSYLNKLNMEWTSATARLSPQVLLSLMKSYGKEYIDHLSTLDPEAPAIFSVAWAGQNTSPNWFHIAREYTERFLHQQQIRDSTGKPGLMTREYFYPFMDILMNALPHTYRNVSAPLGTRVSVVISTQIGGRWDIVKTNSGWEFDIDNDLSANATVTMSPEVAWKLFSKGLSPLEVRNQVEISGDIGLGLTTLQMVSVMA